MSPSQKVILDERFASLDFEKTIKYRLLSNSPLTEGVIAALRETESEWNASVDWPYHIGGWPRNKPFYISLGQIEPLYRDMPRASSKKLLGKYQAILLDLVQALLSEGVKPQSLHNDGLVEFTGFEGRYVVGEGITAYKGTWFGLLILQYLLAVTDATGLGIEVRHTCPFKAENETLLIPNGGRVFMRFGAMLTNIQQPTDNLLVDFAENVRLITEKGGIRTMPKFKMVCGREVDPMTEVRLGRLEPR